MNDSTNIGGLPGHGDSTTDEADLFAFTNALRLSVKAKVIAEQNRGVSLSEIVVQVREMVRIAEEDARNPRRFPSRAFRAISRQAVGWCVESYRPLFFAAGTEGSKSCNPTSQNPKSPNSKTHNQPDGVARPPAVAPAGEAAVAFPAMTPAYRGLP
jgi:hypothetical protein